MQKLYNNWLDLQRAEDSNQAKESIRQQQRNILLRHKIATKRKKSNRRRTSEQIKNRQAGTRGFEQ